MKILIEESVLRQALELWETGKGIELGNLLRAAIKAAEKVEPVAWISTNTSSGESCIARSKITSKYEGLYEWQPLYLHPPSAEIESLRKDAFDMGWRMAAWRIAATWADRYDLYADIGSPAYIKDRDTALEKQP